MTLKPPVKCTCHIHQTKDIRSYKRDLKLSRRIRRDSLKRAAELRSRLATETDPEERAYLETIIVCVEWSAWLCLLLIRESKAKGLAA